MGPKVAACMRFVRAGGTAVIASLTEVVPAMHGEAGTRIVPKAVAKRRCHCPPIVPRLGVPSETDSQHAPAAFIRGSVLPAADGVSRPLPAARTHAHLLGPSLPVQKANYRKRTRGAPLWNE